MTDHSTIEFSELLASHQPRLYRYIVSLLGDAESSWDVLQETNRILLEKRSRFEFGTSFANWALTVAQYQTMAWLRDKSRDRHVVTAEIVELLAEEAMELDAEDDARQQALAHCMERLPDQHRELVHFRYVHLEKLSELSARTGRTVNALKQFFFRVRGTLADCVEQRLGTP
ncbi:MAG: sigma-70 family RNA polymerase sigma factor [Planctomycetales bacterium]